MKRLVLVLALLSAGCARNCTAEGLASMARACESVAGTATFQGEGDTITGFDCKLSLPKAWLPSAYSGR